MKVRNLISYRDRETKETHHKGEVREVSAKRGKELIKKGFAVEASEPAEG